VTVSFWDGVPPPSSSDAPVAFGGDLDPRTLADAYRRGIFPWPPGTEREAADLRERFGDVAADLPWWSPDPRGVIPVGAVRLSRSLRSAMRSCGWTTTVDRGFAEVLRGCAEGRDSAWITPALAAGYRALHDLGIARSIEVWDGDDLVGGMYGVLVGGVFSGESMFRRRSDASKMALADMAFRLDQAGAVLLDTQFVTPHLATMGAVAVPREHFLAVLAGARDAAIRLDTGRRPVSRLPG
jgi:leucyl/phenylalanyl-tRNA---protein transferase